MKRKTVGIGLLALVIGVAWAFLALPQTLLARVIVLEEQAISPLPIDTSTPTPFPTPTPLPTISPDETSPWAAQNLVLRNPIYPRIKQSKTINAWNVATSPVHNLILYSCNGEKCPPGESASETSRLVLFDLESSEAQAVAVGESAYWSPSGEQAVFFYEDSETGERGLGIFDRMTGEVRRVARLAEGNYIHPEPLWISEHEIVFNRVTYNANQEPHFDPVVLDTDAGRIVSLGDTSFMHLAEFLGLKQSPRIRSASAASDRIVLASSLMLIVTERATGAEHFGMTHLLPTYGGVTPTFNPEGDSFIYNGMHQTEIITLGEWDTHSVSLPTGTQNSHYVWTPDGTAVLISAYRNQPWTVVNKDGSGLRFLEGTAYRGGSVEILFTKDYAIVLETPYPLRIYRVTGE